MAIAIRAAIDAVPPRLARDPGFDVGHYGRELANLFDAWFFDAEVNNREQCSDIRPCPGRRYFP